MSCIRPGDIVAFYWVPEHGKVKRLKVGLVLHWTGDPDQLAHVAVDGEQRLFRVYVDRMVKAGERPRRGHMLITAEQGRRARQNIERYLASKAGQAMLERLKPVERADRYWIEKRGEAPLRGPSSGGGAPCRREPPLITTERGSSRQSGPMDRYMFGTRDGYAMRRLSEEHPDWHDVVYAHEGLGMQMQEVADSIGITRQTAYWRKHQGKMALTQYRAEFDVLPEDDKVA